MIILSLWRQWIKVFSLGTLLFVCVTSDFFPDQVDNLIDRNGHPLDGSQFPIIDDSFDEGSVNRVIDVLRSNVFRWSFVESQLLEPNVDLAMVRI